MIVAVALLVQACGNGSRTGNGAATKPALDQAADADIRSGCWKASDRGAPATGGNGTVAHQQWKKAPDMTLDFKKTYTATLETNKGTITVLFYPGDAPTTVNNFVCLARAGYYDGTPFHRIVKDFVIQGGDPTGTGSGGPGYQFIDEPVPANRDYVKGTLAMANAGKNTNGSQFFICLGRVGLPKSYNIFGEVTGGMDVVDAIGLTSTKVGSSGEKSTPMEDIILKKVTITEA